MFNAFERMVALRYLRARRREGFISVIAGFSLLGIMLGVATLIIVMSVMNGFREELLSRILGVGGHITVASAVGPLKDFDTITARVRQVYSNRCALTGLHITNGGGRPEVQAAHIRPVASSGPDSTRNGIALSGTVHWMFDRGLMSLEDDGRILLAKRGVPPELRNLLRPELVAALPDDASCRPHPQFLRFHRETVFKG